MSHLGFAAALGVAALLLALLEIQIEGEAGWAAGLPTWRVENRWTRWLLGRRPLTGYHLYLHLLVLAFLHLPFALGLARPTLAAELRLLAFLVLFWILEDFLWFVLHPRFGLRRFRRSQVPWHQGAWWGVMPREYWLFLPFGLLLYAASRVLP